jgi:hypothetical protein
MTHKRRPMTERQRAWKREYVKRWRASNPERARELARRHQTRWYEKRGRSYFREWRRKHPTYFRELHAKRKRERQVLPQQLAFTLDAPPIAPAPVEPPAQQQPRHKTLFELRDEECRWPIGDPRSPDFGFCAAPKRAGSSYCAEHHARAIESREQPTYDQQITRRNPFAGNGFWREAEQGDS